jgi:hypothetical protein
MFQLDSRTVRHFLVPLSCVVFVASLAISGVIFFRGKPFDPKQAVISDLESPDENPRGYVISALGTAASSLLLVPAAITFYGRLRDKRPRLALAGAVMFALGLGAAIAIGILASSTHGYSPLHIRLAFAAFIGIAGGSLLYLIAARSGRFVILLQSAVMVFLIYLYLRPTYLFQDDHLLTSLAFWEWMLCLDCGLALWKLASSVEAMKPM